MILPLIEVAAHEVHVPKMHHPRVVPLQDHAEDVFKKMLRRREVETVCLVLEGDKLAVPPLVNTLKPGQACGCRTHSSCASECVLEELRRVGTSAGPWHLLDVYTAGRTCSPRSSCVPYTKFMCLCLCA